MSESFKNFCNSGVVTSTNSIIVVPAGVTDGANPTRLENTSAQIHSIYVSMVPSSRIRGINRYNPENFIAFDLCIESAADANFKYYIVHDGRVVPGAPFFIEKNITLEPEQKLVAYCPNNSYEYDNTHPETPVRLNQDPNTKIHISASAVLLSTIN